MIHEPLSMYCYVDLSGTVRGKGAPASQHAGRIERGIGWTPTNLMFTALGTIAPSPWGPYGDLVLKPDPDTAVTVDFADGTPAERFTLCDLTERDGTPWECCPRTALKSAVDALSAEHGLSLFAAFEHEFVYAGANTRPADMYALDAVRRHGAFGETLLAALAAAGVPVDTYLPEFGPGQFEVTVPPVDALAACDRAVILREVVRATAFRLGHGVTFAPRVSPTGLGSGVHIHFSLWDADGAPVSHDAAGPHGVSATMGHFLAGVVRHLPALCAFTVPSPISYVRLVPHAWTGVWSNIGVRDREAGLRICPVFGAADAVARQFNVEYRPADATANPYLAVAAIIRAGLAGLAERLPMPEPTVEVDPDEMTEAERAARSIVRLPASLGAALDALEADPVARTFLPAPLHDAYLVHRRHELGLTEGWDAAELCRRYSEVY